MWDDVLMICCPSWSYATPTLLALPATPHPRTRDSSVFPD